MWVARSNNCLFSPTENRLLFRPCNARCNPIQFNQTLKGVIGQILTVAVIIVCHTTATPRRVAPFRKLLLYWGGPVFILPADINNSH